MSKGHRTTPSYRRHLIEFHGTTCRICGESPVEYHHLIPLALGGVDEDRNIIPLCEHCHKIVHGCIDHGGYAYRNGKGGRPRKQPQNYENVLNDYAKGKIGAVECKKRLGMAKSTHVQDCIWIKEYFEKCGFVKVRNQVDYRAFWYGDIPDGTNVGYVLYKDGTRKEMIWGCSYA